jgi:transposase InsO family protein
MATNKKLDKTLERNFLKSQVKLVSEYEQVKQGKHLTLKFAADFYKQYKLTKQNFIKFYNRYRLEGEGGLLPRKRGRRFGDIRVLPEVQKQILELRNQGHGRYDVHTLLQFRFKENLPSVSTIYNVFVRHNVNRINDKIIQEKQRYIRETVGELMHIDCHVLSKDTVDGNSNKMYLVGMIDDKSRYVMLDLVEDIKSITVTNVIMKMIGAFEYLIGRKIQEVLTDNGSEFGGIGTNGENPFKNLMKVLNVKHRHTKAYRPQTNGKIERFWKTLDLEFFEGRTFKSIEGLRTELIEYQIYYNYLRSHQGLEGEKPIIYLKLSPN